MSLAYCGVQKCVDYMNGVDRQYRIMDRNERLREFLMLLFHVFSGVVAASIAWARHASDGTFIQVLMSVLAFLFGTLYLVYITGVVIFQNPAKKQRYLDLVTQQTLG